MDKQIVKANQNLYQRICDKASKLQLIEQYADLSLPTIVKAQYPSIGKLEQMHGKEPVIRAMSIIVADLNASFGGDLNKEDFLEIATEIRSGITRNITLEGLYFVCSQLKRSSTFKLKIPNILKAIDNHLEEQCKLVMSNNYNQHLQTKQREPRDRYNPNSDDAFRQFQAEYFKRNLNKDRRQ